ncbi:hypothetical protein [Pseudomonas syringae]|uniref:hypothetical protein n=1 Tax=Pseudomonas syringae TaxID=317 RepID=UPI0009B3D600|nr:hypothetical protein [Pseudomonas syringae]
MNGFEHPTRETPAHAVYRLSWLAYANVIMTSIFLIAVSLVIGSWTTHNAQSDAAYRVGITVNVFVLVVTLAVCAYRFMHRNFKMPMHQADAMKEASCLHSDA